MQAPKPLVKPLAQTACAMLVSLLTILAIAPAALATDVAEVTLTCGQQYDITSILEQDSYFDPEYITSSNTDIIDMILNEDYPYDSTVYVKAGKPGVATLYQVNGHVTIAKFTVKEATITRNGTASFKLGLNKTKSLSVTSDRAKASISWKTSNTKVATVSNRGVVTAKGAGTAKIRATSLYGNTVEWTVTVPKVSAKQVTVAKIAKQTYTGKKIKPALTIKYSGKKLKAGTDYTVKYKNNKAIGKAKAIITFKGSYTGKLTKAFKIVRPKVGKPTITYWFYGDAYSKIEWDGGTNCTGTQLRIVGGGSPTYDKHISGDWGYGYCYKSKIGSSVTFSIRSYKTVKGKRFYSKWVHKKL